MIAYVFRPMRTTYFCLHLRCLGQSNCECTTVHLNAYKNIDGPLYSPTDKHHWILLDVTEDCWHNSNDLSVGQRDAEFTRMRGLPVGLLQHAEGEICLHQDKPQ